MSKPRMYGMTGSMRKCGKRDPFNRQLRRPWTAMAGKSGQAYGSRNEMYAYICHDCGAYLDPGERCDCRREEEKAAPDGANTGGGRQKKPTDSIQVYCGKVNADFSRNT